MKKTESPAETQYRLASEAECRRIAELVKKELSPRLGFVLVTADFGDNKQGFSNTSYVATIRRPDAQRLLTELLDSWKEGGLSCEPSVSTATRLREIVFDAQQQKFTPIDLHRALQLGIVELDKAFDKQSAGEAISAAIVISGMALALFDSFERFRTDEKRKKEGD